MSSRQISRRFLARLSDRIDLVIDLATLGEYGLEPRVPGGGAAECRAAGCESGWEASTRSRRRGCESEPQIATAAIFDIEAELTSLGPWPNR